MSKRHEGRCECADDSDCAPGRFCEQPDLRHVGGTKNPDLDAQLAVIALLVHWNLPISAAVVGSLVLAQAAMMVRFLASPVERALWLSALGVTLYVLGMLASAIGVRGLVIA